MVEHVLAAGRFQFYGTTYQAALALLLAGGLATLWFVGGSAAHQSRSVPDVAWLSRAGGDRPAAGPALHSRLLGLQKALPLQLCDLASAVAVYALRTRRRWAAALTYFGG